MGKNPKKCMENTTIEKPSTIGCGENFAPTIRLWFVWDKKKTKRKRVRYFSFFARDRVCVTVPQRKSWRMEVNPVDGTATRGRSELERSKWARQETIIDRIGGKYHWWFRFCFTGTCTEESCNCIPVLSMAVVMCFIAGWVNGVAVIVGEVTVTHVTGSWTFLGLDVSGPSVRPGKPLVEIVFFFAIGAFVSGLVTGGKKFSQQHRYGVLLLIESVLLFMGVVIWEEADQSMWAFAIFAMAAGMQNALVASYSGLIIRTTHLTGTWTDTPMILGMALHRLILGKEKSDKEWKLFVYIPEVICFVFGASAGGAVARDVEILAMLAPASAVFLIGVFVFIFEMLYHREAYQPYRIRYPAPKPIESSTVMSNLPVPDFK